MRERRCRHFYSHHHLLPQTYVLRAKSFFFIKSISISTIFPLWCLSLYKWLKAAHVQNRQDFSTLFFPKECINRKQIWHQKLWKINIIAFSKTLSKVSFISSPHCHKRSNKNVFLFPAKRPPHVLRYPHYSLLHLKQKEHFLLHFQGQCHGIYMCQLSYKLGE